MASGMKNSMPNEIFVIFNGYEYRTYTTPETLAQALADGYGLGDHHLTPGGKPNEIKMFVPVDFYDDNVAGELKKITSRRPPTQPPYFGITPWNPATPFTTSPADEAKIKAQDKAFKTKIKAWKTGVLDDLYKILNRKRP